MITLTYRTKGDHPSNAKQISFETEKEFSVFIRSYTGIIVMEVERSGALAMNRIFGGF